MKKRLKNKLQKRCADNIIHEPIFCKIKASKSQLESIGCDRDIMECFVEYIKDYPTGYSQIKIERKDIGELLNKEVFEFYDIPKIWIEFNY